MSTKTPLHVEHHTMNVQNENTLTAYWYLIGILLVSWNDVLIAKGQMDAW